MTSIRTLASKALAASMCAMFLLGAALPLPAAAAGESSTDQSDDDYWRDKNRGWFFYERKPKPVTPAPTPAPAPAPAVAVPAPAPTSKAEEKHPDLVRFEALQKRVEDTKNVAIMNPTEENLRAFLAAQWEALTRAENFAKASQQVVWATPEFDANVQGRPSSATGSSLWDAQRKKRREVNWAAMSESHAFFFFFKSDCPYCHRFAPILRDFSEQSGISVMPISIDGMGIPGFEDFKVDNGIATRLNVRQVPALFLAEPKTGKVLPVGYGVISPSDLVQRIDTLMNPQAETVAPSTVQYVGDVGRR